jgi:hypothetical protein
MSRLNELLSGPWKSRTIASSTVRIVAASSGSSRLFVRFGFDFFCTIASTPIKRSVWRGRLLVPR